MLFRSDPSSLVLLCVCSSPPDHVPYPVSLLHDIAAPIPPIQTLFSTTCASLSSSSSLPPPPPPPPQRPNPRHAAVIPSHVKTTRWPLASSFPGPRSRPLTHRQPIGPRPGRPPPAKHPSTTLCASTRPTTHSTIFAAGILPSQTAYESPPPPPLKSSTTYLANA